MANVPPRRPSGAFFRPESLGRYEIVSKIAGGGMATIYLGRAPEPTGETLAVALKIIRQDLRRDPTILRMFVDEGELLVRLRHPNVVRTYEVDVADEHAFIAMELLLGTTLAAVWDTCVDHKLRLHPEIAAWIAARVCEALEYAHDLSDPSGAPLHLVHRDVNPTNVFLTFKGEVKLFDFGLAKVLGRSTKSAPGIVKGKLPYLSPEQIMQFPLDRRSDVFGLGTTLWEMLTSRRLFRMEDDAATLRAVQRGPIPDVREYAPDVPDSLAPIVKRALERNRDHRYPSARALGYDLDMFLAQRGVVDVPARLSAMLDTLFPGEQKRQSGWLKPSITGARGTIPPSSRKV
jgi:serine/threonine protein kinase